MKDKISQDRINLLHPHVRGLFQNFIEDAEKMFDTTFRVVQGLRTIDEQNELYAQGRTKPGKVVTNAKGGSSYHNYGLAIDIVEMKGKEVNWNFDYKKLHSLANRYGLTWGGDFKSITDKPHFELSNINWKELYRRYTNKQFIPGTHYVQL